MYTVFWHVLNKDRSHWLPLYSRVCFMSLFTLVGSTEHSSPLGFDTTAGKVSSLHFEACSSRLLDFEDHGTMILVKQQEECQGRAVMWLGHYATNQRVAGSIPNGVTGIFQ